MIALIGPMIAERAALIGWVITESHMWIVSKDPSVIFCSIHEMRAMFTWCHDKEMLS